MNKTEIQDFVSWISHQLLNARLGISDSDSIQSHLINCQIPYWRFWMVIPFDRTQSDIPNMTLVITLRYYDIFVKIV